MQKKKSDYASQYRDVGEAVTIRAREVPGRELFLYLQDGEELSATYTYSDLLERARAAGAAFAGRTDAGDRILLLYEPSLEYVAAFFGCLLSGRIAVPVYPPNPKRLEQTLPRLMHIVEDAGPSAVATTSRIRQMAEGLLDTDALDVDELSWCATDEADAESGEVRVEAEPGDVAFLQYTSGSTRQPRGVRVTHRNLLHNISLIEQTLGATPETVGVSWLPMYHDMGLIGKILTPAITGCSAVLMSPRDFLRKPVRWLEAIDRFDGTVSAAPNFAYDLCVRKVEDDELDRLDLSSWRVALNGAEPVRAETLEAFAETFAPAGFDPDAFLPAYGLAESTLLVTGAKSGPTTMTVPTTSLEQGRVEPDAEAVEGEETRTLVSSGSVPGQRQDVRIVDPVDERSLEEGDVGEIWVAGPSVADGYWGRPDESRRRFQASVSDDDSSKEYLRTGDLGFRTGSELVVTGRRSDLMIIRGRNIYPQDVEATVAEAHESIRPGGMAVFSIEADGGEVPIVVAEMERRGESNPKADDRRELETLPEHAVDEPPSAERVAATVRRVVTDAHRIDVGEVVLIKPGTVPKTSSGKIQRNKCREQYLADDLESVGRARRDRVQDGDVPESVPELDLETYAALSRDDREEYLVPYLAQLLGYVLERPPEAVRGRPLTMLGVDSLTAMELQGHVEDQLGVRLFPSLLLGGAELGDVAEELADAELPESFAPGRTTLAEPTSEVFGEAPADRKTETISFAPGGDGLEPTTTQRRAAEPEFSDDDIPSADETRELEARDGDDYEELSWNERGVWLYQATHPESADLNLYFVGKVPEEITYEDVEHSVGRLVRRHANLRSEFTVRRGEPMRRYIKELEPDIEHVRASDWSAAQLESAFEEQSRTPFDLEGGTPIRFRFFERDRNAFLMMVVHHVVADFWSMEQLIWELGDELRGEPATEPPEVTYADFCEWQREMLESQRGEWLEEFWSEQLADPPPKLTFPTSQSSGERSGRGRERRVALEGELVDRVSRMASRYQTTPYVVYLAVYQLFLYRWTGQSEFFVGAVAGGRTRSFFESTIGMFVNPLPLRSDISPQESFEQQLLETKGRLLRAMDAQEYPLQKMVEESSVRSSGDEHPLLQTLFASEQPRRGESYLGGLELVDIGQPGAAFPFSAQVVQQPGGGELRFQYDSAAFGGRQVERLGQMYRQLIEQVVEAPDAPVGRIRILLPDEQARIQEEWARGPRLDVPDETVVDQFQKQAAQHPDRLAIDAEETDWTYGELRRAADRVTSFLRDQGVERGDSVGLFMTRSPELVAAMLGVLRAGAAFVPLKTDLPADRLEYTADDAAVSIALANEAVEGDWPRRAGVEVHAIEEALRDGGDLEDDDASVGVDAVAGRDRAYTMYTSGTTGRPKGVMIEHRNLRAFVGWAGSDGGVDASTRTLWKSPIAFDASVLEVFQSVAHGGTLAVTASGTERDPGALAEAIGEREISYVFFVPSQLELVVEEPAFDPPEDLTVFCGGEPWSEGLIEEFARASDAALHNVYGTTETTIYATHAAIDLESPDPENPIGRPLENYTAYVLDGIGEPVPAGVPRELYVGGPGVGRGYRNMPKVTALRFAPDAFADAPGARLYGTGDVVRWNDEGELVFVGRDDNQVQLQGVRIELEAVETALQAIGSVKRAAVKARQRADGRHDALLAAVVPADPNDPPEPAELEAVLEGRLPRAALPSDYAILDELPHNVSGKVDRSALPDPGELRDPEHRIEPRTETERRIASIWKTQLELDELGVRENFFEVGGHSLIAVRIKARVEEEFDLEIPLEKFMEHRTVATLAAYVDAQEGEERERIERHEYGPSAPLSAEQKRLWYLQKLTAESLAYQVPVAIELRGPLDERALRGALEELVDRHEVFRTTFPEAEEGPIQRIHDSVGGFGLDRIDVSEADDSEARVRQRVQEEIAEPFELEEEFPLRGLLLRRGERSHVLLMLFHHIAIDEWTIRSALEELEASYRSQTDGEPSEREAPELQYADYAIWQKEALERGEFDDDLAFWREELRGAPEGLDWPMGSEPIEGRHAADSVETVLESDMAERLRDVGGASDQGRFAALLSVFTGFLARYTGQYDLTVGVPVTQRNRPELQDVVGFFLNTLPFRARFGRDESYAEIAERIGASWEEAHAHQQAPLAEIVEAVDARRRPGRPPLFDVMFTYLPYQWEEESFGDLQSAPYDAAHIPEAKLPLNVSFVQSDEALSCTFEFDSSRFERTEIEQFVAAFERFVRAVVEDPGRALSTQPVLSEQERGVLGETWARGPTLDDVEVPIHGQFEERVREVPERTALVFDDDEWSYAALNRRANAIAGTLRELGVECGESVGVYLERSPELIAALLGVMKAGGAYVALEPNLPQDRLAYMASDAAVEFVVAREAEELEWTEAPTVSVERAFREGADGTFESAPAGGEHFAYVLYTSGTTGRPKGVMMQRGAVREHIRAMNRRFPIGEEDVVLHKTPYGFDVAVPEIFQPLTSGGRLAIARPEADADPKALAEEIERYDVTDIRIVPALLRELVDREEFLRLDGLERVLSAGEALTPDLRDAFLQGSDAQLWNLWGPTEATVYGTIWNCRDDESGEPVPIGRVLDGKRLYVVDDVGELSPGGVLGELCVGGREIAVGYRNKPGGTAEAFVPNPYADGPGERLYRTGDLVRWDDRGVLQYLGRSDRQVQIHGIRVELGEVEACLEEMPGVQQSAVLAVGMEKGRAEALVGYVVAEEGVELESGAIRAHLRSQLQPGVVPARYVSLDEMPTTPSGKIDRGELPEAGRAGGTKERVEPQTFLQEQLAKIWSDVLEVEAIGIDENFFSLGGTSLDVPEMQRRIRDVFGVEVPYDTLVRGQTLRTLADAMSDMEPSSDQEENNLRALRRMHRVTPEEARE